MSTGLSCYCFIHVVDVFFPPPKQMLEGSVKKIALDFDVESIAKAAKVSKDAKVAEVGADIELLTKQN